MYGRHTGYSASADAMYAFRRASVSEARRPLSDEGVAIGTRTVNSSAHQESPGGTFHGNPTESGCLNRRISPDISTDIHDIFYGYLMNVRDDVRESVKEKSRRSFPLR